MLGLLIGLAFLQGLALLLWGSKGMLISLGVAYIYFVFRWPHLALVFAVVIIFDGLGLVNPETFLRVPGAFRLRDLVFVSLFLPLLFNIKWQRRGELIFHRYHRLLFPVIAILLLTTLQMVRTSLQYSLPLRTCVMAGRHYWFYAFLPLAAIYLDASAKRKIAYRLFLVVISALAGVVIIQTVVYALFQARLVSSNIHFGQATWGNLYFFRIYPPGEAALVLVLSLSFWAFFLSPPGRQRRVYIAPILLCGFAVLLLNSRIRWLHVVVLIIVPIFLLTKYIPKPARRSLYIAALVLSILISAICFSSSARGLLAGVTERATSAWTDFRENKGTWRYRVEDSAFRLRLIRKHPLFGVGLVHALLTPRLGVPPTGYIGRRPARQLSTLDSGIVTLLVHFGLVGAIWAIWYFISVLRFCLEKVKFTCDGYVTAASIGVVGYMIGGILVFITLGLFTMPGDIIGCSFMLGILASNTGVQTGAEYSKR